MSEQAALSREVLIQVWEYSIKAAEKVADASYEERGERWREVFERERKRLILEMLGPPDQE